MKMLTFAKRCAREILRDPINLGFGLGFPLVLLVLLSLMKMVLGGTMKRNSDKFYTDGKVNHGLLLSPLFLIKIYKNIHILILHYLFS